ncbi:hypothetical protein ACIA03_29240 [Nocardioides sp. NPDC051685]|uniref:hypothetical protein n=1 Tax=Nocardioides sp. NPDC051685 TaxID=3364334 RepID=UPI0037A34B8F
MDNIEEAARALLDARITSVRALVAARQKLADLRTEVTAAEREDARLYQAALRDGWSVDELKKLGLGEAEKVARTRSKKGGPKRTTPAARPTTAAAPTPPSTPANPQAPSTPAPAAQAS